MHAPDTWQGECSCPHFFPIFSEGSTLSTSAWKPSATHDSSNPPRVAGRGYQTISSILYLSAPWEICWVPPCTPIAGTRFTRVQQLLNKDPQALVSRCLSTQHWRAPAEQCSLHPGLWPTSCKRQLHAMYPLLALLSSYHFPFSSL